MATLDKTRCPQCGGKYSVEWLKEVYSDEFLTRFIEIRGDIPILCEKCSEKAFDFDKKGGDEMNVIMTIYPYRYRGQWVFDDWKVGLVKEPFVAGADTLIELALVEKGVKNAEKGFNLTFSAVKFPDYDLELVRTREEAGGWWYYSPVFEKEGWLCPALFKYFEIAPEKIYAKFEEGERRCKQWKDLSSGNVKSVVSRFLKKVFR